MRRIPLRPPSDQDDDFRRKYDYQTFIYDAAFSENRLRLLAPPFLNLTPIVETARIFTSFSSMPLRHSLRSLDRHSQIDVEVAPNTEVVHFKTPIGLRSFRSTIADADFYAGKRVLLAKSKDNELSWISDWVTYHQIVHRADAVLLFDNGSRKYDLVELVEAIAANTRVDRIGVVSWPFPFGPRPSRARVFDSDYCQYGALESAHHRFLPKARSV
ncbi:MAG TPA: hypothetical protein VGM92_11970, partial [Candidatus Kapabacteria bacterium]